MVFCALAGWRRRRYAYRNRRRCLPTPVIVVGNISVGGNGKTPLVIYLVERLRANGRAPGIVSRGYGGRANTPQAVSPDSDPRQVGDEAVLLAGRCRCPVVVGKDRVAAAQALLLDYACDVVVADDGLQHYALARDIEIAVIDGQRRFGNGFCLPAGPLREPPRRLREVDWVVGNGSAKAGEILMTLHAEHAHRLSEAKESRALRGFRVPVHAIAGIGNPQRFFTTLREHGLTLYEHPFPDHHRFSAGDLDFGDDLPILMTEKDAVKCRPWASERCWYVPVCARLDASAAFERALLARLHEIDATCENGHG